MRMGVENLASAKLIEAVRSYEQALTKGFDENVIQMYINAAVTCLIGEKDIENGLKITNRIKKLIDGFVKLKTGVDIWGLEHYAQEQKQKYSLIEMYYATLKIEAYWKFESFIYYMERNRDQEKRFYYPRRRTLGVVVQDLEDLRNRVIKHYCLSMGPRVGKSTICIFYLSWSAMRSPNAHSAMGGHSGILAKGFYKELMNLMTTEEYTFAEIYSFFHPGHEVIRDKSAEEYTITLDEPDRFATITCRGIDGTWTGAVDVSDDGDLYVDDLIRDREHSLSPSRMENTWQEYLNKMVDRKHPGAGELNVGTLWSVLDPIHRLEQKYGDDPSFRFRRIPALNENDESNYDYDFGVGFTTEYYHKMRDILDDAEWQAKFQQRPYVREGLLMPADELRYFNGIMPDGDYRTVGVCDVAYGGGDSLSMPVGREYENGDVYIFDWIFSPSAKEITIPRVSGAIIGNEIRDICFEGNQGGDLYCGYVDAELRKHNYKCSCTSRKAPNTMSKREKIVAYSGDIKRKFIFLSAKKPTAEELEEDARLGITRYVRSGEYQKAMDEVCSYTTIGKIEHEDAIDSLTQMAMKLDGYGSSAKIEVIDNPFRHGGRYF